MSKKYILFCLYFICHFSVDAQVTYLNQIYEHGDGADPETTTNIELSDSGYVSISSWNNNGIITYLLREYDYSGEVINIKEVASEDYVYIGYSESFQKSPNGDGFYWFQSIQEGSIVKGKGIRFDNNLNVIWETDYNLYPPYTNIFHFAFEADGIIVCGSNSSSDDDEDLFLMKCDYDGNVIWNNLVSEEDEQFERCIRILPIEDGYLIAGMRFFPSDPIIKRTDVNGEELWELNQFDEDWDVGGVYLTKSEEGEFVGVVTITTETIGLMNYRHPLIFKVNIDEPGYYWTHEFPEHNYLNSGAGNIHQTNDGGFIISGQFSGGTGDRFSYLLKINSNGEEEWFKEYYYNNCSQCVNLIQDIELAPDGGYICAGYFEDWENDPYRKTWLLKVDACGDVEWQGCEEDTVEVPVISEGDIRIWPNPTNSELNVLINSSSEVSSYNLYNYSGQLVSSGSYNLDEVNTSVRKLIFDFSDLSAGMYVLSLLDLDGSRLFVERVVVE